MQAEELSFEDLLEPTLCFHVAGEPIPQGSKSILPAGAKRGNRALLVEGGNRATKKHPGGNRLKKWRATVGSTAKLSRVQAGLELFDEPLVLGLLFVMPRPKSHRTRGGELTAKAKRESLFPSVKPDLSKLIRAAEDAMQGTLFRDDSLVVGYRDPWKIYDDETPAGLSVEVWTCGS